MKIINIKHKNNHVRFYLGRCARAGRDGTAYSIFSTDDQAHLLDLHLFLSRPFSLYDSDSIGTMPPDLIEEEQKAVIDWFTDNDIAGVYKTSNNAYKHYLQTRPTASADSNKRIKTVEFFKLRTLSDFTRPNINEVEAKATKKVEDADIKENFGKILKEDLLIQMKKYRPSGTVFELNPHKQSVPNEIMKQKREVHQKVIEKFKEKIANNEENERTENETLKAKKKANLATEPSEEYISSAFNKILQSKKRKDLEDEYTKPAKKKKKIVVRDEDNYIPYHASDKHTEDGLAINSFNKDAQNAEISVTADNQEGIQISKKLQKWDRIRKKMVTVQVGLKIIFKILTIFYD